ncbi:ATP-binding protein [Aquabacterium sp.]|uniref:ATP-binding protein n=1 Tax=Aquabacterium sp. TaxID=1872578 RepID=UPI002B62FDB4|nr:ATP-binding protein [Aquabacterium sp.]HSW06865.1 ATP-binding protein [Aquabacterium sp.]
MNLRWPRTLFGRIALLMFAALALAHLLTFGSILRERGELTRSMMTAYLGRDVATAVAVLDRLPAAERSDWLPRLARQNYHYTLQPAGAAAPDDSALALLLASAIAGEIGAARVGPPVRGPDQATLQLPLRLADGGPLTLQLRPSTTWVSTGTALLLGLQLLVLAAATWWGVRLAVRPLSRLAAAADASHAGHDTGTLAHISAGPLTGHRIDELGPQEVARAARAFNAMQQRIEQQLAERLHLLAAISHDLQTPITRLRLRAEQVNDAGLRDKLLADLQAMQALVEEGLAYARTAQAAQEPLQAVDLNALVDGLVCDASDAGHDAQFSGRLDAPLITRVQALRRLLTNLIDNALKFGGAAQVRLHTEAGRVRITVLDRGPGIPEAELTRVLVPFYRVDSSRNRDNGGTGLGLAIAQQLAMALGGELTLHNRPEGGLEARLALPLATAPMRARSPIAQ